MSHKVLIAGTAYAVAGGDTLASGTSYQLWGANADRRNGGCRHHNRMIGG